MTDSAVDTKYMQMALTLAAKGKGSVEPNPVVGCIIVKAGQVIGKGWHKKFGAVHAEINALEDCKKRQAEPAAATMYVTLEPCRHYGKTGPCTEAIIAANLGKVVIATLDPSEHACGQGAEQLRNAGIEVQLGLCEKEAQLLNAPFFKFVRTSRVWVILKWAQSIDGRMAWGEWASGPKWISNELSRRDVHKLSSRVQAILVGINTILADDPLLTARPGRGKKPLRIVTDSNLRIPLDCRLLKTAKKTPVLIVTTDTAVDKQARKAEEIKTQGAELLPVPTTDGRCDIRTLLDELGKRRIQQLLVEGGPTILTAFLKEQLADELWVYIAPKLLCSAGTMDITEPMADLSNAVGLKYINIKKFNGDVRITGLLKMPE